MKGADTFSRLFGEFILGGNAAKTGQVDRQIAIVKKLEIKGKAVTVPEALKKDLGITDEPTSDDKVKRKVKRAVRKKAREEAKSNKQRTRQ